MHRPPDLDAYMRSIDQVYYLKEGSKLVADEAKLPKAHT